jgi:outer membrane protein assembly factor BamB
VTVVENDSESYSLGVDASTGKNLWRLERPKNANWTSPVPFQSDASGRPVALLQSAKGILAVDPATGSKLWEYTEGASTMSSSVVAGGVIYAPSNGITALTPQANNAAPEQLWRARQINPSTISPVVLGGKVFSFNGAGVITTADATTGALGWKLRLTGPFSSSPVGAGSHLVAINEKGLLQVVDTAATEGAMIGQLQLPLKAGTEELVLCTPALSKGHVFVRSDSTLWRIGG